MERMCSTPAFVPMHLPLLSQLSCTFIFRLHLPVYAARKHLICSLQVQGDSSDAMQVSICTPVLSIVGFSCFLPELKCSTPDTLASLLRHGFLNSQMHHLPQETRLQ